MLSPAQPTPQPWSSGWTKQSCEAGVWPTCPALPRLTQSQPPASRFCYASCPPRESGEHNSDARLDRTLARQKALGTDGI